MFQDNYVRKYDGNCYVETLHLQEPASWNDVWATEQS